MKNRNVTFRINPKEDEMLKAIQARLGYRMGEIFRIGLRKVYVAEVTNQKEEEQSNL